MFLPIIHHLKTSEEIIIREAELSDAQALIDLCKGYLKETTSIPLYEDEFDPTIEFERNWIKSFRDNKNSILLLAEHEGKLIGNIDLTGNQRRKLYHTGVIGMGVDKDWRGKGVGSVLMEEMIRWAEDNSYLKVLWLQVYDNNKAGIGLYTKMGFDVTGEQEGLYRESNGEFIGSLMMTKYL